jgi:hypothetical protein
MSARVSTAWRYLALFGVCLGALLSLGSCQPEPAGQIQAWQSLNATESALRVAKLGSAKDALLAADAALQAADEPTRFVHKQRRSALQAQLIFLRGNLAFAQSEQKLAQAEAAFGKPADWTEAVRLNKLAELQWKAARGRAIDWPAARRNIERALARRAEIMRRAEAAGVDADPNAGQDNTLTEQAPPQDPQGETPSAPPLPPPPSPERIDALLDRMQNQEDKKRSERRAQPGLDSPAVERDW